MRWGQEIWLRLREDRCLAEGAEEGVRSGCLGLQFAESLVSPEAFGFSPKICGQPGSPWRHARRWGACSHLNFKSIPLAFVSSPFWNLSSSWWRLARSLLYLIASSQFVSLWKGQPLSVFTLDILIMLCWHNNFGTENKLLWLSVCHMFIKCSSLHLSFQSSIGEYLGIFLGIMIVATRHSTGIFSWILWGWQGLYHDSRSTHGCRKVKKGAQVKKADKVLSIHGWKYAARIWTQVKLQCLSSSHSAY